MSAETPTRMRGALIGPLPEPDGADQDEVAEAVDELEPRSQTVACENCGQQRYTFERCQHCGHVHWADGDRS